MLGSGNDVQDYWWAREQPANVPHSVHIVALFGPPPRDFLEREVPIYCGIKLGIEQRWYEMRRQILYYCIEHIELCKSRLSYIISYKCSKSVGSRQYSVCLLK